MSDLKQRTFGRRQKNLADLSDSELEEEVMRRRRERASGRSRHANTHQSPQDKQLAQCYANLELEPGASVDDVKSSYRRLMKKYHPDKHLDDPSKHKAATELAQSLTTNYRTLLEHLEEG